MRRIRAKCNGSPDYANARGLDHVDVVRSVADREGNRGRKNGVLHQVDHLRLLHRRDAARDDRSALLCKHFEVQLGLRAAQDLQERVAIDDDGEGRARLGHRGIILVNLGELGRHRSGALGRSAIGDDNPSVIHALQRRRSRPALEAASEVPHKTHRVRTKAHERAPLVAAEQRRNAGELLEERRRKRVLPVRREAHRCRDVRLVERLEVSADVAPSACANQNRSK